MRTTTMMLPLRLVLLALVAVAFAGPAAIADENESDDHRVLTIDHLGHGDCPRVLAHGGEGAGIMSLGSFGYLGVSSTALTPELRRHFGVPEDVGILISRVEDDSPAAAAGLRVGDIVTRIDDEDVTSGGRLQRLVRRYEKGDVASLELWRDGKVETTTATLGERPRCGFDVGSMIELENLPRLDFEKLTPDMKALRLHLENLPRLEHLRELHQLDGEALEKAREYVHGLELYEIDDEALENARERLRQVLESQDWKGHFERIRDIDLNDIGQRLHEVMERLDHLENEIQHEKTRIHSHDQDDGGEEI